MIYMYCRTSTKDQKYSLSVQETFMIDSIPDELKGLEFEVIKEHASGKTYDRGKYQKLIMSLRNGDILMFYDASRISRSDDNDLIYQINKIIKRGVRLFIEGTEYNSDNESQWLTLAVQGAISGYTRIVQNKKSRSGIKVKKNVGEWIYTGKLYGYLYNKGKIEIVEEEAKVIRTLFIEYAKGRSLLGIEKTFEKEGIKSRNGKKLYSQTLRRYLLKPIYMGYYLPVSDASAIYSSIEKDKLIKSTIYPEIVEPELWWKVYNSFRTLPRKHAVQFERRRNSKWELSGILRCGYCDAGYVHCYARYGNIKKPYYTCRVHKKNCPQKFHHFQEPILLRLFHVAFNIVMRYPDEMHNYYDFKRKNTIKNNDQIAARIELLKQEKMDIEIEMENMVPVIKKFHNNSSMLNKLYEDAERLENKKEVIDNKIQEEERKLVQDNSPDNVSKYIKSLVEKMESGDEQKRREIYLSIVARAIVYDMQIIIAFFTGRVVAFCLKSKRGRFVQKEFDVLSENLAYHSEGYYNFTIDEYIQRIEFIDNSESDAFRNAKNEFIIKSINEKML